MPNFDFHTVVKCALALVFIAQQNYIHTFYRGQKRRKKRAIIPRPQSAFRPAAAPRSAVGGTRENSSRTERTKRTLSQSPNFSKSRRGKNNYLIPVCTPAIYMFCIACFGAIKVQSTEPFSQSHHTCSVTDGGLRECQSPATAVRGADRRWEVGRGRVPLRMRKQLNGRTNCVTKEFAK